MLVIVLCVYYQMLAFNKTKTSPWVGSSLFFFVAASHGVGNLKQPYTEQNQLVLNHLLQRVLSPTLRTISTCGERNLLIHQQ